MKTTRREFIKSLGATIAAMFVPRREVEAANWRPIPASNARAWFDSDFGACSGETMDDAIADYKRRKAEHESGGASWDWNIKHGEDEHGVWISWDSPSDDSLIDRLRPLVDLVNSGEMQAPGAEIVRLEYSKRDADLPACRLFTAEQDSDLVKVVYLDGEDITDNCTAAMMACDPGIEVDGWADLFTVAEQYGRAYTFVADSDGNLQVDRIYGTIRWEKG